MKLISFDVGIKNMAYCIFDISTQNLSINSWNVLNLLEEEPVSEICTQMIPGKTKKILPKPCIKMAKYRKNGECYCEKHAKGSTSTKGSQFIIPNKKNSLTYLKKQKVEELLKIGKSHFLFLDATTVPKLKKDILLELENFYEKNCFEPISKLKTKNASEIDLITIGKNMKESLHKVEGINEVTHVIIENQISPIANRMKTIQGMLAQYFIMNQSNIHIEFVSSGNKLGQFIRGTHGSSVRQSRTSLETAEQFLSPKTPPLNEGFNNSSMTPPLNEGFDGSSVRQSRTSLETAEQFLSPETPPLKKTKLDIVIDKKAYSSDSDLENTMISTDKSKNKNKSKRLEQVNPDYKQHKQDALYYGSLILEKNPCFESYKDSLQKRKGIKVDDLADSFLQGIWYLKKQNIISYADDLKIIFV